ncbi:MAG: transcription elongation factor GreA [Leptospirales bacterium]|nr:transcription elongation factor GreA [Leptospirales bacterium]
MSQTVETEVRDPLYQKVVAQINEEKLVKDLNLVQLSKFKNLDDIAQELGAAANRAEIVGLLEENLKESGTSLVSRYVLGLASFRQEGVDIEGRLKSLLDHYSRNAKWTIVDHIADRILETDENNRTALRAKVDATERLKGKKELRPFLERLAQIDRKNPDVVKKFALSILDEDAPRAISSLKQAAESYARLKDYRNLEEIWNLVVQHDYKDLAFFERIERILVGNREKTRAAAYLVNLVEPHRAEENWPAVISVLKKILEYQPDSTRARGDLVRAYRSLYENHSLLAEFLKMSDLTNHKKPVGPCIASFERNIVFDKGNYVYHRTRGVGKIAEIDKDQVIVDFRDNPGQRMSIQMAISSLQPITSNHFWVRMYEAPADMEELFKTDLPMFFEMLLSSFGSRMTLAEIKSELTPRFLSIAEWSKWWTRARTVIKDHPRFGFNLKKKDEIVLRENEVSPSEELSMRFQAASDWNQKLDLALESLKSDQTEDAAQTCVQFYRESETSRDALKQLHSFLFLELAQQAMGEEIADRRLKRDQVRELIQKAKPKDLIKWCAETTAVDMKREIVNWIARNRPDYAEILEEILFEVPIKVNRHVLNELNRTSQEATLKSFLHKTLTRYREHPETFLWAAKGILTGQWNYSWVEATREDTLLMVFRLLKPLNSIEKKGTRLKNTAIETILGTGNITVENLKKNDSLGELVLAAAVDRLRRMYALFREVPYVADAHKENFLQYLSEMRPDFSADSATTADAEEDSESVESLLPPEGVILVSAGALQKRREHLDHLINVVMPANSRDIGEAMEKGDLRENAEYKAAMERQSTLQAEIQQVSEEVKRAEIIEPKKVRRDVAAIGSLVELSQADGSRISYRILGPWDADTEQNIISYASPLAQALLGKKVGESASLDGGPRFKIESLASAFG